MLQQTYAEVLPELSVPFRAECPPCPEVVFFDEDLGRELGIGPDDVDLLTGQIDGTFAQAYAGHQFGSPVPVLGDGRAVLLGEVVGADGERQDLHLKGAGRTPFARGGDGKAPLGPMLREAVIGRWLHAIGVPSARILAVLRTGEEIAPRQGMQPEVGAMAVRVAASHLRVGTFQYAAWHHDEEVLGRLVDYAIARHHPAAEGALGLLEAVARVQAKLVAGWMVAGFVHGVMNTDNMTISGQSIDHGPCAILEKHDARAVFSSIDVQGRYAYGSQAGIALWNLCRFAEALHLEAADAVPLLEQFEGWFEAERAALVGDADLTGIDGADHVSFLHERGIGPVYAPRNEQLEHALAAATVGNLEPVHEMLEVMRAPYERRPGLEHLEEPGGEGFVTFCGT